ncbi:MAG: FAD-dependent oxidoreductase [Desulfobacteraceae bacterium]
MSNPRKIMQTDVVVVGSGPGGATVARELSRRGKKVIVCEAGAYHKQFGYTIFMINMLACKGLTFSREGTWVVRPKTAGGASVVFSATAFRPPTWLKERYGIDLKREVKELYEEIPLQPLPDGLIGPAARKIMQSAQHMGFDWKPLDKWIRPEKCRPNCGRCHVGCNVEGAKWTAREFLQESKYYGAKLLLKTHVDRMLTENGKAVGVRAKTPQGWIDVMADIVVLSAGGQGTPPILQRAGLFDAGQGLFADPLCLVLGVCDTQGSLYDIPMTAGTHLDEDGIIMTDFQLPPTIVAALLALSGPTGLASLPKLIDFRKTLTIMVKVKDSLHGWVHADESFSKPFDPETWWKLNKGAVLAEDILLKAGVKREKVMKTALVASHPGGTVRIGNLLDKNCQTPIKNCYCLDTSIIPEAWGLPPTVTIVAMGKRLAKHLTTPKKKRVTKKKASQSNTRT